MTKAKKVLELGLFTGCAALAIAETLPDDGVVYSCENVALLCGSCTKFGRQITSRKEDSYHNRWRSLCILKHYNLQKTNIICFYN